MTSRPSFFAVAVFLSLCVFSIVTRFFNQTSDSTYSSQVTEEDTKINKYAAVWLQGLNINDSFKPISSRHFPDLIAAARNNPRKRKMTDLTKNPAENTMQVLINTWYVRHRYTSEVSDGNSNLLFISRAEGSFSPVHKHTEYSEVLIILIFLG